MAHPQKQCVLKHFAATYSTPHEIRRKLKTTRRAEPNVRKPCKTDTGLGGGLGRGEWSL